MRPYSLIYLLLFLLVGSAQNMMAAKDIKKNDKEEEISYIDLASLLISDGFYDRAAIALKKVELTQEGLDLAKYYTLNGLVDLYQGDYKKSIGNFKQAISSGQENLIVYVYLAQSYYALKDYESTITSLDFAREQAERASLYKIKINCYWQLKKKAECFKLIGLAEKKFPSIPAFTKQKIIYLISLALYREATRVGISFLARPDSKADDYLLIGESMRRTKQYKKAIEILELARLKHPNNEKIIYALAHSYTDLKSFRTAAKLFEEASYRNPAFTPQAVELYRKAKRLNKAMALNAEIRDQKIKTKQRLGILLEEQRYVGVVSLKERLARLGLLEDQKVSYAFSYALLKTGDYENSVKYLNNIIDKDLYTKRTQLRKAIDIFKKSEWLIP